MVVAPCFISRNDRRGETRRGEATSSPRRRNTGVLEISGLHQRAVWGWLFKNVKSSEDGPVRWSLSGSRGASQRCDLGRRAARFEMSRVSKPSKAREGLERARGGRQCCLSCFVIQRALECSCSCCCRCRCRCRASGSFPPQYRSCSTDRSRTSGGGG